LESDEKIIQNILKNALKIKRSLYFCRPIRREIVHRKAE